MFIVPITDVMLRMSQCGNSTIMDFAPIRKGDKDIFIQEEFRLYTETQIDYKADTPNINLEWKSASQMTKKESRYTISECIGASAVRVQDIPLNGIKKIIGENSFVICDEFEQFRFDLKKLKELYNNQLKESNINRTYEDNDYVFLLEVKR